MTSLTKKNSKVTLNYPHPITWLSKTLCALLCMISCELSFADTPPVADINPNAQGAEETSDSDKAIELGMLYLGDYVTGLSGPISGHNFLLGDLIVDATVNNEKIFNLPGNSFYISLLNTQGAHPNNTLGSVQGIDNIDVVQNTTKIYQAWMQQNFAADKGSFLVGLYDLNSEFYVTDSSLVFINPSMGIGSDFGLSGLNGPSVFQTPGLAGRLKVEPSENLYLMTAVYDGVPGNLNHPVGTHIVISADNGVLVSSEVGALFGQGNKAKLGLGGWYYSSTIEALNQFDDNGDPLRFHDQGIYVIADLPMMRFNKDPDRGLNVFFRYGTTNPRTDRVSHASGFGFIITGPTANRSEDVFGFAVIPAVIGIDYLEANPGTLTQETIYELTYSAQINKYIALQPDLQFIHPYNDETASNSIVGMLRLKVEV